jgi:hypothetical protein
MLWWWLFHDRTFIGQGIIEKERNCKYLNPTGLAGTWGERDILDVSGSEPRRGERPQKFHKTLGPNAKGGK